LAASPVGRGAGEANRRGEEEEGSERGRGKQAEGKMFDSLLNTKFYNKWY
jgi:hypothetical protein